MRRAAVVGCLLVGGCSRCAPVREATPDAAPPPSDASVDAAAEASTEPADAAIEGGTSRLELDSDAIHAWFSVRGVDFDGYTFARCHDTPFGPEHKHVLACVDAAPYAIDPSMGLNGPIETRFDLLVMTARGPKRVDLLRVPLALGEGTMDYATTEALYFTARYEVDGPAGAIDVVATPDECAAARAKVSPFHDERITELRQIPGMGAELRDPLIRAHGMAKRSDTERIAAICRAAGHYTLAADGKLAKTAK